MKPEEEIEPADQACGTLWLPLLDFEDGGLPQPSPEFIREVSERLSCGSPFESDCTDSCYADTERTYVQPQNFTEWRKRSGWLFAIHWWFERLAYKLYADEWRWMQNNKRRIWHGCELAGYEAPWYAKWVSRIEFRLRGWSSPKAKDVPVWRRLLSVFRSGKSK